MPHPLPWLLACVSTAASAGPAAPTSTVWHACDESLWKSRPQTRIVLTAPTPAPENPLLSCSTPAESGAGNPWFSVMFDPHEKFYKAWYGRDNICYGTSHNGLLWNKPLLTIHPDETGGRTSVLVPKRQMAAVWRDDADRDEGRLFKMIAVGAEGAELRHSANGIQWSEPTQPQSWGQVLHPQVLSASDGKATHVYWHRPAMSGDGKSAGTEILRSSTTDSVRWNPPQTVAEGWLPGQTLRSFAVSACGTRTLVLAGVSDESGQESTRAALLTGKQAVEDLGPLPGLPGHAQSALSLRDSTRLFFSRTINDYHTLNLATLPPDGLCGIAPEGDAGAVLTTAPLPLPPDKCIIRVTATVRDGGSVEIAALDAAGQPRGTPATFTTSIVNAPAEGLTAAGEPVRLQFKLTRAILHTVRLANY